METVFSSSYRVKICIKDDVFLTEGRARLSFVALLL